LIFLPRVWDRKWPNAVRFSVPKLITRRLGTLEARRHLIYWATSDATTTQAQRQRCRQPQKRLARKADRSVRTILRLVAVIAALVAGAVYWNFGTLSPCGVIREVIRQRSDMADIIPDGVIDFGFETQFGEMSANRCFAVLLENLTSPVPTTEQASQSLSMQPLVRRQGKQRSSPSVRKLAPFAL
jgi:hypothetical protein